MVYDPLFPMGFDPLISSILGGEGAYIEKRDYPEKSPMKQVQIAH